MSNSIGHRPFKRTDGELYYRTTERAHRPWHRHRGAWSWHTGYDLRYTNEERRRARSEGRRAVPEEVRPGYVTYTYGRGMARSIAGFQVYRDKYAGAARGRERAELRKALRTVRSRKKYEFDRTLDITPYRTRGQAIWDAT